MGYCGFESKNKNQLFIGFLCLVYFSLFLIFRKSYAIVIAVVFLFSLWTFKKWFFAEKDKLVTQLSLYLLAIGIIWSHSFDHWLSWSSEGDYLSRYGLGALGILALGYVGVNKKFIFYGVAFGAIFAGIYALIQFPVLGRAEGYTNAIRFGNLALLMSVFLMIFSVSIKKINFESAFFMLSAGVGLVASFLSLSRGGWIFLPLVPFILIFLFEGKTKIKAFTILSLVVFVGAGALSQLPFVQSRVNLAQEEVTGYFNDKEKYVQSSVGARLEQWQMSWKLGLEKPIFGWGDKGVDEGRSLMVKRGEVHPMALNYPHTHHEFLEIWATRGIVGVVFLLFYYMVPLYLFFPSKEKINKFSEKNKNSALALYLAGLSIPLSYFTFGLTDVFFNLSIGHAFMVFSLVFIVAGIQGLKNDKS